MEKFNFKKIKTIFTKIIHVLATNPFWSFLVLLFFGLILSVLVLYKYEILVQESKIDSSEIPKFNEQNYERVLKVWNEKEERFEQAESKEYTNPFKSTYGE